MNCENLPAVRHFEYDCLRDYPISYNEAELETKTIIGERTGDEWTKFILGSNYQYITIKNKNIYDPYKWR
jgi:hypothetical protein